MICATKRNSCTVHYCIYDYFVDWTHRRICLIISFFFFQNFLSHFRYTMSTEPKKPDANTGTQGIPLTSIAPQSGDNANRRYEIIERGQLHTLNYRCYFRDVQTKAIVSPFHDIPLVNEQYTSTANGTTVYNMIVEVPRWTNAKMEINKQLKLNPIVQDIKSGLLRV